MINGAISLIVCPLSGADQEGSRGFSRTLFGSWNSYPASILYKSTAGRYRPVRVADGPITARCSFIKNAYWDKTGFRLTDILFSIKTIHILQKNPIFWNVLLSDLTIQLCFWQVREMIRVEKIIQEEYCTFVRLEK